MRRAARRYGTAKFVHSVSQIYTSERRRASTCRNVRVRTIWSLSIEFRPTPRGRNEAELDESRRKLRWQPICPLQRCSEQNSAVVIKSRERQREVREVSTVPGG